MWSKYHTKSINPSQDPTGDGLSWVVAQNAEITITTVLVYIYMYWPKLKGSCCLWGHRLEAGVGFSTFLRLGFMLGFDMLLQVLLCAFRSWHVATGVVCCYVR